MKRIHSLVLAFALLFPTQLFAAETTVEATITFTDFPASSGGGSAYSQRLQVYRSDINNPIFKKVGSTVVLRAGTEIEYLGTLHAPTTDQSVTLPTLVSGTDYRIAIKTDGSLQAYTYAATLPSGSAVIGGFHYLPGGVPTNLDQGGNWTPEILKYSIWDVSFRPTCLPQGMSKVGHTAQWLDIYFQGNSSNADGVSRNNDPILTGGNPPLIPADYGGNGTAKYSTLTWWEANEHLAQFGKHLPDYATMTLAAFGTNEQDGRGSHPVTTGLNTSNSGPSSDPNFTGHNGHLQITGVLWQWLANMSYYRGTPTANTWNWEAYDVTGGRGKLILDNDHAATAMMFGGQHSYQLTTSPTGVGAVNGSRTMETIEKLWDSSQNIAIRGACDHFIQH